MPGHASVSGHRLLHQFLASSGLRDGVLSKIALALSRRGRVVMVAYRLPRLGSIDHVIAPDFIINHWTSTHVRPKALLRSEFRISLAWSGSVGSSSARTGLVGPLVSSSSSSART